MQFPKLKIVYKSTGENLNTKGKIMVIGAPAWRPTGMSVSTGCFAYNMPFTGFAGFFGTGQMPPESFANTAFYNYLPLQYTNYGGDFQVSLVTPPPDFMAPCTYNYLGQQITGTTGIYPGFGGDQPSVGATNVSGAVEQALNIQTSQNLAGVIQGSKGLLNRIDAELNKEDIPEDKKSKLTELKTKVETLKQDAEQLKDSTDTESQEALNKSKDLQKQLRELNKEFTEAMKTTTENTDGDNTGDNNGDNGDDENGDN